MRLVKARTGRAMWLSAWLALIATYLACWMYPNFPLFLDNIRGTVEAPRYDYLLLALTAPLVLVTRERWIPWMRHPLFHWSLLVCAMYAVAWWRGPGLEAVVMSPDDIRESFDVLQRSVLLLVYGYLAYVIGRRRLELPLKLMLVPIVGIVLVDFAMPELFDAVDVISTDPRAEGSFINSNIAGEAMLITLVLVYRRLRGAWLVGAYLLVGLGEIATFSRGGMGAWFLFGVFLYASGRMPRWSWGLPLAVALFYSSLLIWAEEIVGLVYDDPVWAEQVVDRLSFFGDVAESGVTDSSGEERQFLFAATLQGVLDRPLLGHGFSPEVPFGTGAHNMPLQYWYHYGLPGLASWLWMLWLLNRRAEHRLYGLISPEAGAFFWFSMFSHTLFSFNYLFLFFAMTCCGEAGAWRERDRVAAGLASGRTRTTRRSETKRDTERETGSVLHTARRRRTGRTRPWRGRFG